MFVAGQGGGATRAERHAAQYKQTFDREHRRDTLIGYLWEAQSHTENVAESMAIAGACTALLGESWAVLEEASSARKNKKGRGGGGGGGGSADEAWHAAAARLFRHARKEGTAWAWFLAGKAGNHAATLASLSRR